MPAKNSDQVNHEFTEFNLLEYNLFWLLHLVIIILTIMLIGGDLWHCLESFSDIINPLHWIR